MAKPDVLCKTLDSGAELVRFDNLQDIFWYDDPQNSPSGIRIKEMLEHADSHEYYMKSHETYFKERRILTKEKQSIIDKASKNMQMDREFLELVYKAKSVKREYRLNRFGGNLSMAHYASNSEKIFKKGRPGAKKVTLNMAFQVRVFSGGNYADSFVKILKTILMCQAMGISVNIDMFDSDTRAIDGGDSYVICNVAKSHEKLNLKSILTSSHPEFFHCSLFNGYGASGKAYHIGTFLNESKIRRDLGSMYDVIGGNTLTEVGEDDEQKELISRILKIGLS